MNAAFAGLCWAALLYVLYHMTEIIAALDRWIAAVGR
jgi:hypothetical protein